MPRVPTPADLLRLMQEQTEALAQLPKALMEMQRAALGMLEVVANARETLSSMQSLTARADRIVAELEEPLLALKPGIERVARALDDPVVDTIPDTLRQLNEDVVPLVKGLRETQAKVGTITSIAEETTRLAGLPVSLLFPRRSRPATGIDPDVGPDPIDLQAAEQELPVTDDDPGAAGR